MQRTPLIVTAAVIALGATSIAVFAHDRDGQGRFGMGPQEGRGGPAMMFEEFDADGDGTLTEAEMQAAALARFTEADSDGDGKLSVEELVAAAEARMAARMADRLAQGVQWMLERHDSDGDGLLSLEEASMRPEQGFFEHFDRDGDGVITKTEAERGRGHRDHRRWGLFGRDHD